MISALPAVGQAYRWLIALFGAGIQRLFIFLTGLVGFLAARRLAIVTAFIGASAILFLGVSMAIKAAVMAARMSMPPELAMVTYFLPPNLNQFFATLVVIRLSHFTYRWTYNNLAMYADVQNRKLLY